MHAPRGAPTFAHHPLRAESPTIVSEKLRPLTRTTNSQSNAEHDEAATRFITATESTSCSQSVSSASALRINARAWSSPMIRARRYRARTFRSSDRHSPGTNQSSVRRLRAIAFSLCVPDQVQRRLDRQRTGLRTCPGHPGPEAAFTAHRWQLPRDCLEARAGKHPHPAVGRQARRSLRVGEASPVRHQSADRRDSGI